MSTGGGISGTTTVSPTCSTLSIRHRLRHVMNSLGMSLGSRVSKGGGDGGGTGGERVLVIAVRGCSRR